MQSYFALVTFYLILLASTSFVVIPTGTDGGLNEGNLSGFFAAENGSHDAFIGLDAGNVFTGLALSDSKTFLSKYLSAVDHQNYTNVGWFFRNQIKAYFVSHSHLDHVAGLVINSADDDKFWKKPVISNPTTISKFISFIWNWDTWPNVGFTGTFPPLEIYNFTALTDGVEVPIANTSLTIELHNITHTVPTSAALVKNRYDEYLLFFGDCEADAIKNVTVMRKIWQRVAPLVRDKKLLGIFLEASFENSRPDSLLFGHLTPRYIIQEMYHLGEEVVTITPGSNLSSVLKDLTVVVTHIKPLVRNAFTDIRVTLASQFAANNTVGVKYYFPEQGRPFILTSASPFLIEDQATAPTTTSGQTSAGNTCPVCVTCPTQSATTCPTQSATTCPATTSSNGGSIASVIILGITFLLLLI